MKAAVNLLAGRHLRNQMHARHKCTYPCKSGFRKKPMEDQDKHDDLKFTGISLQPQGHIVDR